MKIGITCYPTYGGSGALATELAGRVGVTLLVPGGMRTAFFDGRTEQYKPGPDADLLDPAGPAGPVDPVDPVDLSRRSSGRAQEHHR